MMRAFLTLAALLSVLSCERSRRAVTTGDVAVYRLPLLETDARNDRIAVLRKDSAVTVLGSVDIKTTMIYKVDLGDRRTGYVPSTPKLHFVDPSAWEVPPRR